MTKAFRGLVGLIAVGLLGGCTDATVSSSSVRTKGLWASFNVTATRDGATRATAQLRVGGDNGTVVDDLDAPDELTFQVEKQQVEKLTTSCPKENTFCSQNISDDLSGKVLTFAFDRGDEDENALDSTVKMPDSFAVRAGVTQLVRGQDLPITVTGSSSSLRWELVGDCIWPESGTLSGGKIPAAAFDSRASRQDEDCDVRVTFTRSANGKLDPQFGEGGQIKAVQERSFTLFTLASSPVSPGDPSSDAGSSSGSTDAGVVTNADAGSTGVDSGADASDATDAGVTLDAGATQDAASDAAALVDAAAPDAASVSDAGDAG
jgi:hypothetical protein